MPLFSGIHHGHGLPAISTSSSSHPSRPSSRPPSPTRTSSGASGTSAVSRSHTIDSADPSDYGALTIASLPAHGGVYANSTDMRGSTVHFGSSNVSPVEIILDSDHLVMRGQGGDMNPAYLSGRVDLTLQESANIKGISMNLTGKAKVQFSEAIG